MSRKSIIQAVIVGALLAAASTAYPLQIPQLHSGHPFHGELNEREQRIILEVPQGHIAQVRFSGEGVHLDLRDKQGRHLRRLVESGRGVLTATWRSRGGEQEQLWVVAADPQASPLSFQLELLNTWPSPGPEKLVAESTPMGPRLQALSRDLEEGGSTEEFWREIETSGAPLIEPWADGQLLVTFLWRDQGNQNVRLFGSPSGNHNPLQKLEGSDVWWTSVAMDPRARLSYGLAPDVPKIDNSALQRRMILSTLQRDSLNPKTFPSGLQDQAADIYQGRSLLVLPEAAPLPWESEALQSLQGTLERHVLHSQVLDNAREVFTYVPSTESPQNLLVLFDAHPYLKDVRAPHILDWLIAQKLLPSTAVVLVGNASPEARGVELPPNPKFAQFMAQEVMPRVQRQGLGQTAHHTAVAGSSYGGLVSSYLALMHPELFGNVLSMSGSYWWAPSGEPAGWMQRAWQNLPEPMPQVRFYLDAGLYESDRGGRRGILETTRELEQVLRDRGVSVAHREWVSGHDYAQWQASLACGLVALFSPQYLQDPRLQFCAGHYH